MDFNMYDHYTGIQMDKSSKADLEDLFLLKQESWWGTHTTPFINREDQLHWYENLPKSTLVMNVKSEVVHHMNSNPVVTNVGVAIYSNIDPINRSCDLSGSIFKKYRSIGTGVNGAFLAGADFGFEMLNLNRIQAEVLEYHLAAQKLEIDLIGFMVEGRRREAVYKANAYYDSIMLGMTRSEWEISKIKRNVDTCCNNVNTLRFKRLSEQSYELFPNTTIV